MEPVNKSYELERVADDGKTLKPLDKSALLQKRGMAVLVASLDGKPMLYGMDRVAAVIDTVPIYGESHMGIVAIYGRGLTLGDSDYGITWVAYDYNSSESPNSSSVHCVDANKMAMATQYLAGIGKSLEDAAEKIEDRCRAWMCIYQRASNDVDKIKGDIGLTAYKECLKLVDSIVQKCAEAEAALGKEDKPCG